MSKIKVGLPKGRFCENSLSIIANEIDRDFSEIKNSRCLFFESERFLFYLLKPSDICKCIFSNVIDIGIVPDEWILEFELQHDVFFQKLKKIEWIKTRISLLAKIGNVDLVKDGDVLVSSYPYSVKSYFYKSLGLKIDVYSLNGSVEAFVGNVFDFGVDCVESGGTLVANDLVEKDVLFSDLSLSLVKKSGVEIDLVSVDSLFNNDDKVCHF